MDAKQLSDELNLKAMTALTGIIQDEARGLISPAQAATGVRAIFDMSSGLISSESFELISLAAAEYKGKRGMDVQLIKSPNGHLEGVLRVCGTGAVLRINRAVPHLMPTYADDADVDARTSAATLFNLIRNSYKW